MKRFLYGLLALGFVCCLATPALAELRIGIGVPRVNIRITLPAFPEFVLIPGLPVYHAPRLEANYFFYDGYYWTYIDDNWYASDWYNGPWWWVDPFDVPLFILRVPIRYYRIPPVYFRDWPSHQPPRWGQRWGHDWERRHHDWDRWEHNRVPHPAPLPDYQRQYSGKRYPKGEEQERLHRRYYRHQPDERSRDRDNREMKRPSPLPEQRERERRAPQPERPQIDRRGEPQGQDNRRTIRPPAQRGEPQVEQRQTTREQDKRGTMREAQPQRQEERNPFLQSQPRRQPQGAEERRPYERGGRQRGERVPNGAEGRQDRWNN